ncbi:MAG: 5-oxoprolinase subunit PxpB [Cyclobacteriaceae bacterium]
MIEIVPFGEASLLINFEQKVDLAINRQVTHLNRQLQLSNIEGITFTIPAYCSLTVGFDNERWSFEELRLFILEISKASTSNDDSAHLKFQLPVCYEGEFAPDMEEVMRQTKLPKKEIIDLHSQGRYTVYMLGFLPGFAYLGTVADQIICQRKKEPRLRVPPRSIGIAGYQTAIYPSETPAGWQLIGQTPVDVFMAGKKDPFLLKAGDEVTFNRIDMREFDRIREKVVNDTFDYKSLHG